MQRELILRPIRTTRILTSYLTRFDEMGVPFVILLNENTLQTGVVRLRHRDTTVMVSHSISQIFPLKGQYRHSHYGMESEC